MDSPRRSARLARNQGSNSSAFSQQSGYSSASVSSYPSPENNMNASPLHQTHSQPSLQIPTNSYLVAPRDANPLNAPLPSPSAADMNPFFGRPHSQPSLIAGTLHGQQMGFAQHPQGSISQQQAQQHQHPQVPRNQGPLPSDFDVLAEAAKRAQMACLMRDLGDVSL